MDESTEGVMLYARFVLAVREACRGMERVCAPVFEMTKHLDEKEPLRRVPIALGNDVCQWLEGNLGSAHVRDVGRAIGRSVYRELQKEAVLGPNATPLKVIEQLTRAAAIVVFDPKGRSFDVLEAVEGRVVVRRGQALNCMLQEGLLAELIAGTGALNPRAHQVTCTRRDSPHCDYELLWLARGRSGTFTMPPPSTKLKIPGR